MQNTKAKQVDRVLKDLQHGDNLVQLLGYMTILDHLSHVLVNAQGVNSFPTTAAPCEHCLR